MSSAGEPRILAGRYRLDEVIGRGGMSTVYRGTDLALDRVVAVKVALDPLVEQSPVYLARFTREAQSAAAIGHPGVVTVYDAGADGPTRFIVMEYVPGRSLAEILSEREHKPLEPDEAAGIAAQVADALSSAHAAGIIHRDIKPGNIMVEPDGSVKVLDFGIARALDGHTLTQTATVLGTSAYMSPEQALGQPVDARSDIYSLGCVLYEMLTGEPPFTAEVSAAVLHQHVRVEPKPARERNPAIPPALNELVMQMLAKSPKDRPQTAANVRDRLRQAPADSQDGADALTTIAMAAAMAPTPATVPIEATEPLADETRGRRGDRAVGAPGTSLTAREPGADDRAPAPTQAAPKRYRLLDHPVRDRGGAAGRRGGRRVDGRRLRGNDKLVHRPLVGFGHRLSQQLGDDYEPAAAGPSEHELDERAQPDHQIQLEFDEQVDDIDARHYLEADHELPDEYERPDDEHERDHHGHENSLRSRSNLS